MIYAIDEIRKNLYGRVLVDGSCSLPVERTYVVVDVSSNTSPSRGRGYLPYLFACVDLINLLDMKPQRITLNQIVFYGILEDKEFKSELSPLQSENLASLLEEHRLKLAQSQTLRAEQGTHQKNRSD